MSIGKKYFLIVSLCLAVYCWACIWSSSQGRIDGIIQSGSYHIAINSCGCFGCGTTVINVTKKNGKLQATKTFTDYNKGREQLKTISISWSKEKDQLLQNIMHKAFAEKGSGWCTTTSSYTLYTSFYAVRVKDDVCAFSDEFNVLFK